MNLAWSAPEFARIAATVTERTGLVFAPHRCASLEQAVRTVMREQALADLAEFQRRLSSGLLPWHALIDHITVGESYFFRDRPHFEFLCRRVLPELVERCGAAHRLRVWSAGCASGEEAYSLAITLEEEAALEGAFVLGSDLCQAALARARRARYRKWSMRETEPHLLRKYFRRSGDEFELCRRIVDAVVFEELNLASGAYPSPLSGAVAIDFILCRNVLIYLSPTAIGTVSRRLFQCLAPGGYLLTGPSDPLLNDAGFEISPISSGIAYRRPVTARPAIRLVQPAEPNSTRLLTAGADPQEGPCPASAVPERNQSSTDPVSDPATPEPELLRGLRARCNAGVSDAVEAECLQARLRYPLCPELHYLHALTLIGRSTAEAIAALRRALYLDPSLAIVHFSLGAVLSACGDRAGAARAYRNARRCADAYPAALPAPLAEEITGGALANAAARELCLLDRAGVG